MPKIDKNLIDRYQVNCARIQEIADTCEREKRSRTEAEDEEYKVLLRDNQTIQMRAQAISVGSDYNHAKSMEAAEKILRENVERGIRTPIILCRDLMMVTDVNAGGAVAVKIQDVLEPLTEGLILDKVGLPFYTGLAGEYVWPTYEAVEATIANEGVALSDTKITLDKLTASPQRIGIAIPVTREAINQSEGLVEMIVRQIIPQGAAMLLNKILFSTAKVNNATVLAGPFVGLKEGAQKFSSDEPSFKEYNMMKAEVLKTGIDGKHLCWVMTETQKAIAEGTPKDPGSGIMVCEDDKIAGVPVFTSHYIGEGYIGLGDWRMQPMGLFGPISFVVDPYTQARKNAIDFVFNADYGTTTLRPEAFKLKKTKSAI